MSRVGIAANAHWFWEAAVGGGEGNLEVAALLAEAGHFGGTHAEDEHVVLADLLSNLHVGAVHGANDERSVHRKLHVGRAGRLRPRRADVLAQLAPCALPMHPWSPRVDACVWQTLQVLACTSPRIDLQVV